MIAVVHAEDGIGKVLASSVNAEGRVISEVMTVEHSRVAIGRSAATAVIEEAHHRLTDRKECLLHNAGGIMETDGSHWKAAVVVATKQR